MGHLLLVKPLFPLLYGHRVDSKFFYWSLWEKIGTSRVLEAHPVNQAISHIYLCANHFGGQKTFCLQVSGNIVSIKKKAQRRGTSEAVAQQQMQAADKFLIE